MRALILGGAGFIGSHVHDCLRRAGHEVIIYDRNSIPGVPGIVGMFDDRELIAEAVRGKDCVFHLLWTTLPHTSNQDTRQDVDSNVGNTLHLLDCCSRAGVKKVIFASSGGTVYGVSSARTISEDHPNQPICSYGISKLMVEKYLHLYRHLHDLDYAVLRVSNPYGEGQNILGQQGVVAIFLGRILRGEPITVFGDGDVVRDYVFIQDVAEAFLRSAVVDDPVQRTFNIGSGVGVSLNELLQILSEVTGIQPTVHYSPTRKVDVPRVVLDVTRARDVLGWRPVTSLREGIARTWRWVQHSSRSLPYRTEAA